ncbi:MAG: hypothetical protein Q8R37_04815 [Nanoarchaeota archaeon]|nr:hypothetical protein [Nanoarchaeota archaeon]
MKYYALVNSGLEETAAVEIKEKLSTATVVSPSVISFAAEDAPLLQSVRRLLIALGKYKNVDTVKLPVRFPWADYFSNECKIRIDVEGVKGQENRFAIAKIVAEKLFAILRTKKIEPSIDFKKPELLVIVFFNGKNYYLGIDKNIVEANSREYRVFPHSASFKGDLAYYFVRLSRCKLKEKLLVVFCKDGAIAIEAYFYAMTTIYAVDESRPNFTAARKNAKIANADVMVQRYALDDLDLKYGKNYFDRVIIHVTHKDEDKINEIYYQTNYILKPHGTVLLIGREQWNLSLSDNFTLLEMKLIRKGESVHKTWLLEKQ